MAQPIDTSHSSVFFNSIRDLQRELQEISKGTIQTDNLNKVAAKIKRVCICLNKLANLYHVVLDYDPIRVEEVLIKLTKSDLVKQDDENKNTSKLIEAVLKMQSSQDKESFAKKPEAILDGNDKDSNTKEELLTSLTAAVNKATSQILEKAVNIVSDDHDLKELAADHVRSLVTTEFHGMRNKIEAAQSKQETSNEWVVVAPASVCVHPGKATIDDDGETDVSPGFDFKDGSIPLATAWKGGDYPENSSSCTELPPMLTPKTSINNDFLKTTKERQILGFDNRYHYICCSSKDDDGICDCESLALEEMVSEIKLHDYRNVAGCLKIYDNDWKPAGWVVIGHPDYPKCPKGYCGKAWAGWYQDHDHTHALVPEKVKNVGDSDW